MKPLADANTKKEKQDEFSKVKDLLQVNKAAALGLAVVLTVSSTLTGCTSDWTDDEEEDDSYYTAGSGHYFYHGGTFSGSSWGKASSITPNHKYTSTRAGSIGG